MEFENLTLDSLTHVKTLSKEVVYEITIEKKFFDKEGNIDKGYLFSLIDSVSSKGLYFVDQTLFSVSINLKTNFFRALNINENSIVIKTLIKVSGNLIFMECFIFDKKGSLYLSSSHLKRKINFKF